MMTTIDLSRKNLPGAGRSVILRMKRFSFVLVFLLLTVHRLPAPIQEVQESPKPRLKATPSPKLKHHATVEQQTEPKLKQSPFALFEGTWSGTVTSTAKATFLFTTSSTNSSSVTIRISRSGGVSYASEQPAQGFLSADQQVLTWKTETNVSDWIVRMNCSMRLTGSNVAAYSGTSVVEGTLTGSIPGTSNGTLHKQ